MKSKLPSIFPIALGLLSLNVSGNEPATITKKSAEVTNIEGTWQLTRITTPVVGNPGFIAAPAGFAASLKISFKDGKMTFIPGEPGYTHYTFTTDPKTSPKQLTWKPAEKDGKVVLSIYKIEGDKLTIMFGANERPADFDRKKGSFYEGKRIVNGKPTVPAKPAADEVGKKIKPETPVEEGAFKILDLVSSFPDLVSSMTDEASITAAKIKLDDISKKLVAEAEKLKKLEVPSNEDRQKLKAKLDGWQEGMRKKVRTSMEALKKLDDATAIKTGAVLEEFNMKMQALAPIVERYWTPDKKK